jgi:hypothetical protein
MSAQEQALRDVVIAKIGELRTEMTRLSNTLAAAEKDVRSQPLTKALDIAKWTTPLEGWVQSMMETVAVIVVCGYPDNGGDFGGPGRFERFAEHLGMSLKNWRVRLRDGKVIEARVPVKTVKGHEDVRRVLAARNGTAAWPTQYVSP